MAAGDARGREACESCGFYRQTRALRFRVMQLLQNTGARIANPANTNAIVYASNAWSTTVPGGPTISAWLTFRVHRSWGASVGLCGWFFVISGALSTVWMGVIGLVAVLFLGADLSVRTLLASLAITYHHRCSVLGHPQPGRAEALGRLPAGQGAAH